MGKRLALAALILLGPACPPPGNGPDTAREGTDLKIEWEITDAESLRPRQGDLATIRFTITNRSDRVLVLKSLTFLADPRSRETASAVATWQRSRTGKLTYSRERDAWSYNPRQREQNAPLQTAPVFNSGLLTPNQPLSVDARIRLFRMPRIYHILYFRLTPAELRQKVYFEVRDGRKITYRTLVGQDLRRELAPGQGRRLVLYPHAEGPAPNTRIEVRRMEMSLRPRDFPLKAAAAKAGIADPADVTWCDALRGWILRRGEEEVLVTPSRVAPLPRLRQPGRIAFFVDSVGLGKLEIEILPETRLIFGKRYPNRLVVLRPPQDKPFQATRYLLFLPAREFLSFLDIARETGLEIDVEMPPGGGGRLLVTR